MMGERFNNKTPTGKTNNRHSVCFGGGAVESALKEISVQRRSLSPNSDAALTSKEAKNYSRDKDAIDGRRLDLTFDLNASSSQDINNFISPTSPEKSRRNSRSSIPVYIGRTQSVSKVMESPRRSISRQSVHILSSNDTIKQAKTDTGLRSRRSTFSRNSFSSITSNSSSTSVTNDSHGEHRYSLRHTESFSVKSPSHKRYELRRKASEETPPYASLDNVIANHHSNNSMEGQNNNIGRNNVPVSPSAKSRIPVLRSSSCRSVPHSTQNLNNAKTGIPKNICFGHGIGRTFKTSQSNIKTGQHWYQMIDQKTNNSNKLRSYKVEKYAQLNDMDTESVIDKCNFEDMRMALD